MSLCGSPVPVSTPQGAAVERGAAGLSLQRLWCGIGFAFAVSLLVACGAEEPVAFEKAAANATDDLVAQTGKLPAFLASLEQMLSPADPKAPRRTIVLDPMLDTTGEQATATTVNLERLVTERMSLRYDRFEMLAFQPANLQKAQYLLTGTMSRAVSAAAKRSVRLNLALTDLKTGNVVAQATALSFEENLDNSPSRYFRDSPIIIKDKVSEGYARTAATKAGKRADTYYLERIAAAAVINEATTLYNAERYRDALGQYQSVLSTPAGEQLRVQSGIYLANMKLGRTVEAEQAFGKVVALGIAYNELGVKFLFNPGSTEFWQDSKISGSYGMWLRQIARETVYTGKCMKVVGHTSNSGPPNVNETLSEKRAVVIRQKLAAEAPALAAKTTAIGVGFRENIVGSGTDNGFDVLDRRVEFRIVPCT